MIKVGLTGGIGTGKSFVAKLFTDRGVPVYDADKEAKKLYALPEVLSEVKSQLGEAFVINEQIDFKAITTHVFSDLAFRKKLEQIIHPKLKNNFLSWCHQQQAAIVMMEAAIIFESNFQTLFDYIITVDAPPEVRIERVKQRNPLLTEENIEQRMAAQLSQAEKCKRADFIILNDEIEPLSPQVEKVLEKIKKL